MFVNRWDRHRAALVSLSGHRCEVSLGDGQGRLPRRLLESGADLAGRSCLWVGAADLFRLLLVEDDVRFGYVVDQAWVALEWFALVDHEPRQSPKSLLDQDACLEPGKPRSEAVVFCPA